jgi:hypothetical protein
MDNPSHENNISDGYVIIKEEKIPLERKTILNDRISIIMPEEFAIMSKEDADIKYPSINRADEIYTNKETSVNLSVSHKSDTAANKDIPEVKDALQEVVMRVYPASSVIDSETIEVAGINIAYYDFDTAAIDMDIYNLIFFISLDDRLVLGSFNCPWENMDEWKPVIVQMLGSVEVS